MLSQIHYWALILLNRLVNYPTLQHLCIKEKVFHNSSFQLVSHQCVFLKLNFYIGLYIIVYYKEVIKCFRIPTYFNDTEKSLRRVPKIAERRYKRKNSNFFFSGIHNIILALLGKPNDKIYTWQTGCKISSVSIIIVKHFNLSHKSTTPDFWSCKQSPKYVVCISNVFNDRKQKVEHLIKKNSICLCKHR